MQEDPPEHEAPAGSAGQPSPAGPRASDDPLGDVIARLTSRRGSFGRYRIDGEVGRGGMGTILRVRDEDLHRDLAMKVILAGGETPAAAGSSPVAPRALARFLEEAQVTGQLDHPGIVPVHELGLDEQGRVYFTMRLVAGRDLEKIFALVRSGHEGWTPTRAVGVILKMCEALAYAHDKGVIHRDLKPANVMVGRFGEVYVMDWGLARVLGSPDKRDIRLRESDPTSASPVHSSLRTVGGSGSSSSLVTMDGDVVGTPAYMSPEQARGDLQAIGPASDVYAVGAILYSLLAGHWPYVLPGGESNALAVWRRVHDGPPEPLAERTSDSPAELVAVCEKAMARDQKERYAGMQELAEDLRAYLEGRVVHAYEAGALAEMRKWILRNKALAGTITVTTALIVVVSTTAALVLAGKNEQLVAANERSRSSEIEALENARLALENETKAQTIAAIAQDRAAKILRLSDAKRLEQLEARSDGLWPAHPENVARYEDWLAEARDLVGRSSEHEDALEEIRTRAHTPTAAEPEFASTEDRWQHDTQRDLVARLAAFGEPGSGRITDVERRLEFARTVEERTLTGAEASARWQQAVESISNPSECPSYAGLLLRPQLGLLPIGRDPRSKLWEFAHLQTGSAPARDAETGELALTEDNGLVFVLLPGGKLALGAQSTRPDELNYDPQAIANESPVRDVTLAPFFLSKFEMTQAQWLRCAGKNPSIYGPGTILDGRTTSLLHPVEQVSWTECDKTLSRLALILPTEAQWEYGARSGMATPWSTGASRQALEGAANLADRAAARAGANWPGIGDWPELDDGWSAHAPVGTFRPSAFGLHDMHGNVWEWCRDWFGLLDASAQEGDGELIAGERRFRVNRGGSFYHDAAHARSACRNNSAPDTRANHLGVRPARALGM